jgi:nitroreductase
MEFREAVRKRRMIRSFIDEPLEAAVVDRIIDVARRGPSAGYSQGVEFVVVTDAATRLAIAQPGEAIARRTGAHNFAAQAPVHVVICAGAEIYRARYRQPDKVPVLDRMNEDDLWTVPYWYVDAGAAMMLLLLAAVDEGIGAAFIGGGKVERLRDLLSIPEEYVPIGVALLGHPAPDAGEFRGSAATRKRRTRADVVHPERW